MPGWRTTRSMGAEQDQHVVNSCGGCFGLVVRVKDENTPRLFALSSVHVNKAPPGVVTCRFRHAPSHRSVDTFHAADEEVEKEEEEE